MNNFKGLRSVLLFSLATFTVGAMLTGAPLAEETIARAQESAQVQEAAQILIGAGDIAGCDSDGDEATAALLGLYDGTIFTTGDNVYESGTAQEYADCFDPSWGRYKARIRPALGNHDYDNGRSHAEAYFAYFGANAGVESTGYYSYTLGAWKIFVLNSQCTPAGGCGARSPQARWLKAELEADPHECILAIWHNPVFNSGQYGNDNRMLAITQILYYHGADLVLTGHAHDYERFRPQNPQGEYDPHKGIVHITVGSGGKDHGISGPNPDGSYPQIPNSEVFNNRDYGLLRITLGAQGYELEFIPVEGGTFHDSASGSCLESPYLLYFPMVS